MIKSKRQIDLERRLLLQGMGAGLASLIAAPVLANVPKPSFPSLDKISPLSLVQPKKTEKAEVVQALVEFANAFNTSENPYDNQKLYRLYQSAIATAREYGLSIQASLGLEESVIRDPSFLRRVEDETNMLREEDMVLTQITNGKRDQGEIIVGRITKGGINNIHNKDLGQDYTYTEIIFEQLSVPHFRISPITIKTLKENDTLYIELRSAVTMASAFRQYCESINPSEGLSFGSILALHTNEIVQRGAENNQWRYEQEFCNMLANTYLRHYLPNMMQRPSHSGNLNEVMASLAEIATGTYGPAGQLFNSFALSHIALFRTDDMPGFFNLFEEQGVTQEDMLGMRQEERADIAAHIYHSLNL